MQEESDSEQEIKLTNEDNNLSYKNPVNGVELLNALKNLNISESLK